MHSGAERPSAVALLEAVLLTTASVLLFRGEHRNTIAGFRVDPAGTLNGSLKLYRGIRFRLSLTLCR